MPRLVSWIRECDDALFAGWFARCPQLEVLNARVTPADPATADAVVITGGEDIAGEFLRQPVPTDAPIRSPDARRDAWEFPAIAHALEHGLPLLCICKGVQVLNVALGGTLLLDIPGHNAPEMRDGNIQPLRYAGGARHRFVHVNSSHHQALDRVAPELEVEAWHAGDGIVEQVRVRAHPWAIGTQYHPERGAIYAPLFEDFFAQIPSA